jgi:hypothetical protein
MVQGSDAFGFSLETRGELGSGYFDRDGAIQACIGRTVHVAHASGANLGIHVVGANLVAWEKLQNGWVESGVRVFPGRAIQKTIARTSMLEECLHGTPHLRVGLYQQRASCLAARLERGVIKRFDLPPFLGIRWEPPLGSAAILS